MKKIAVLIAAGSGMGADAAKALYKKGYKIAIMSSSGKGEKLAKFVTKICWIFQVGELPLSVRPASVRSPSSYPRHWPAPCCI